MMPEQVQAPDVGVAFTVLGVPRPQGSKRAFVVKGRPVLAEASKQVGPWRDSVAAAGLEAMNGRAPFDGPLELVVTFFTIRPKSVKREFPSVAPDIDKLTRALADGLTAGGVITDDSRIVDLVAKKRYGDFPCALVTVKPVGGAV